MKNRALGVISLLTPILIASLGGAYGANSEAESYVKSAQRLLQNKDVKGAEIQLRNAVQRDPADGMLRMQLAELYILEGNFSAAEAELIAAKQRGVTDEKHAMMLAVVMFRNAEFGRLLREVPAGNRTPAAESVVRLYRGMAELGIGETDAGRAMLEDAERLDPKNVGPKLGLARMFLMMDNAEMAESKINEALAISPRDSQALDLKGSVLRARGKNDEALSAFNEALQANANNVQALLDRGGLHLDRGDLTSADKDIKAAQNLGRNNPSAIYLDAMLNMRRGNYQEADAGLTKLRALMDRLPEAYFVAGVVKYNLDQIEQADAYLVRYIAKRKDRPQPYMLLGAIALRQRNADRAIAMLNQALALAPDNPQITGLLGEAYMAKGDSRKALALLDEAVKEQPDNTLLKTTLGMSQFTSGQADAAFSELNGAFKGGAGTLQAGPPLVLAALRTAHIEEAAKTAEILVTKEPNNILYQQLLGMARLAQKNLPEAEKIFRAVLDKQPGARTVRQNLAQLYLMTNRSAEAKKLFQDRIAKDSRDVDSMQALAGLYARDKDFSGAAKILAGAASIAPTNAVPRLQLVALYEAQKKWPEAIKEARAAASAFSGNGDVRETLGRVYAKSGDLANSAATYRDAVRAFPNSPRLRADYAMVLASTKSYPAAIAELGKAVELSPRDDRMKAALVELTYQGRGPDAALDAAKTIAKSDPANPFGDILVSDVLLKSNKRAEAIAYLEKAQAASPSTPLVMKLVQLQQSNKEPKRAISLLESWAKAHPSDVEPRLLLAQLYSDSRNYAAARGQFEELAEDRPGDARIINNLAWIYGRTKDPKARKVAEKAYQMSPGAPAIADTLGWILLNEGDIPNAMKYLQVAIKGLPKNPDVQYHYALALSKSNKPDDARALLQQALASSDEFDSKGDAKQLLERINNSGAPAPARR